MGLTERVGAATTRKESILRKHMDKRIQACKKVLILGRSLAGFLWAGIKELVSASFRDDPRKVICS